MVKQIRDTRSEVIKATAEIVNATKSFAQTTALEMVNGPFEANSGIAVTLLDAITSKVDAVADDARANLKASSAWAWRLVPIGLVAVLVAIGFSFWMVRRSVVTPLEGIVQEVGKLTHGNFEVALPGLERKDEIGQMARAVLVFRDAGLEKIRLEEEAAEERRNSVEVQAMTAAEQAQVVRALADGLGKLSEGDLTSRLGEGFADSYKQIKDDFNATVSQLQDTIAAIAAATREVAGTAAEISSSTTDLSQRAEEQAASLAPTTASMEQMSATVKK